MSDETLVSRFVVHRATEWAEMACRRYFLKPLIAEWEADADDNDPVAQLLYDVKSDAIPSDFEFVHKDHDKVGSSLFGEEGIEIEVPNGDSRLPIGAIIDIEIRVIGRVEFQ